MGLTLFYVTWPSPEAAAAAAESLLRQRLVACVVSLPGAVSRYRWEGELVTETETVTLIKTDAARADALRAALTAAHPYDTPALIALTVDDSLTHAPYAAWVNAETTVNPSLS